MEYQELKSQIDDLRTTQISFSIKDISIDKVLGTDFLRKAQIYKAQTSSLSNEEQKKELRELLDSILIERFRKLAPDFSEKQLNKMLCFMNRGSIKYPMDLLVIDDAVFVKEAEIDDFGFLYSYEIIMFMNDDFHLVFDSYDFTVRKDYSHSFRQHPKEVEMHITDIMCDMINKALRPKYRCDVVEPLYKKNTKATFYGYDGMVLADEMEKRVNVYLSQKDFEIIDNIVDKKSFDIKMIVQDGEDISLYVFHLAFLNGELVYDYEKKDDKVWILSENV
ncbi:MAG: hypothetical protein IKI57_05255 [Clostridia bacterium]|nr:hypothetical protein [Clostridia bacterium]